MHIGLILISALAIFLSGVAVGIVAERLSSMGKEARQNLVAELQVAAMFVGALLLILGFIGMIIAKPEWV